MNIFKKKEIAVKCMQIGIVMCLLSYFKFASDAVMWSIFGIGAACLIASGIILMKYWKCPHCGKNLGMSYKELREDVEKCPHCKKKIVK